MPSVRPKLVEIGTPITGGSADEDEDDNNQAHSMGGRSLGTADHRNSNTNNRFVIGGPAPSTTAPTTATSWSPMSKNAGGGTPRGNKATSYTIGGGGDQGHSMMDTSSNSTSGATQKRSSLSSSLARASTGKLTSNKTKQIKSTAGRVSHSYVVGGGDEKKSSDPPMMMMEEDTAIGSPKPRTSVTETSFQIAPGIADTTTENHNEDDEMELDHPPPTATTASSYTIGGIPAPPIASHDHHADNDGGVEKMTGVIDLSVKPPVVVLDGANLAYAYDKAWQGNSSLVASQKRPEPDARGIVVACQYFLTAGIRVLAIVPATMLHREPHQSILAPLEPKGILVPAPPRDDDDAYAITIARREDKKSMQRGAGEVGPGYVMSNDQFRDACQREEEEDAAAGHAVSSPPSLREWLTEGTVRDIGHTGPGRISFTFCDTGSCDDHGDKILDIVPNPRHPMIQFIESSSTINNIS